MANQKLLDVMNGKITDTNQIAEVLANVSSAEFVDVLNHLDDKVIADLMHKLPEDKRSLIDDFGKVRNMMAKIHTKNETWDVSAEEYVKNSENLNKWKVDLNGKDFAQAREVVGWMNVPDEAKQLLMDTAVMKVKEESRNVKNLTEKQYKEAINFEIQLAVYQATVATSAVKQDKNPKVATQEAVNQFVEATRKQIESRKKENKPTTNFLDVSVDSILAYSASTNEWIGNRLAQAKQHFAKTKFGAEVAKITDAANKKLAAWDKKLCEHKTWGKTYKFMKKYSPIVGKVSRSVAVNMGMLALAGMTGPAGAALYAAYAVKTSSQSLIAEYKKEKQSNQNLNFCKFVADNKMLALKGAVGATTMVISGLVGYGNLGVNKLMARAVSTSVMTGLNIAVDKEQSAKGAKKSKSWVKSLALSTAGLALSALGLSSCGDSETEVRAKLPNGGLDMPDDAKARLLAMQTPGVGTDSIKADSTLVDNTIENASSKGTELTTVISDEKLNRFKDSFKAAQLADCDDNQVEVSKSVSRANNDCETKIAAQVKAPDDTGFWAKRVGNGQYALVDPCEAAKLQLLLDAGVFNREQMAGINSDLEFMYKFGVIREMKLPSQIVARELLEKKLAEITTYLDKKGLQDLLKDVQDKIGVVNEDANVEIAERMNSYSNRGNYLCEELKPVSQPATQPVKVEPVVVKHPPIVEEFPQKPEPAPVPDKEEPLPEQEVKEPERRTISIMDVTTGKDYRNPDLFIMKGEMTPELLEKIKFINRDCTQLEFENGDNITYSFKGDDLVVMESSFTVNSRTRFIADCIKDLVVEQYNGEMVDATNAALSVQARVEVYYDLLENNELKGAKAQWGERFMQELNSYGLSYDPEKDEFTYNDKDRDEALAKAQKDAETIKSVKNGELDTNGKNKDGNGFFGKLLNKKANSK